MNYEKNNNERVFNVAHNGVQFLLLQVIITKYENQN